MAMELFKICVGGSSGPSTPSRLDSDCWQGEEEHEEWLQEYLGQDALHAPKNVEPRMVTLVAPPHAMPLVTPNCAMCRQ